LKNIVFTICLLGFSCLSAQNTIGGNKVIVPEAEVKRQSEFLEAEKERLLAHYDKAIERYDKFLYDNPEVDAAWYGLARCYAAKED
jgi:tetratricopeptide (TPR) repeat protein